MAEWSNVAYLKYAVSPGTVSSNLTPPEVTLHSNLTTTTLPTYLLNASHNLGIDWRINLLARSTRVARLYKL